MKVQHETLQGRVLSFYPAVAHLPDGDQILAAMCDVSVLDIEAVFALPGMPEKLEARRLKAEAQGKTLEPLARRIQLQLLQRIATQVEEVDAFEAAELLKPINRVLENADRVRLSERDAPPLGDVNYPDRSATTILAGRRRGMN